MYRENIPNLSSITSLLIKIKIMSLLIKKKIVLHTAYQRVLFDSISPGESAQESRNRKKREKKRAGLHASIQFFDFHFVTL